MILTIVLDINIETACSLLIQKYMLYVESVYIFKIIKQYC